jgi:hypothetical protein
VTGRRLADRGIRGHIDTALRQKHPPGEAAGRDMLDRPGPPRGLIGAVLLVLPIMVLSLASARLTQWLHSPGAP